MLGELRSWTGPDTQVRKRLRASHDRCNAPLLVKVLQVQPVVPNLLDNILEAAQVETKAVDAVGHGHLLVPQQLDRLILRHSGALKGGRHVLS